MTSSPGPPSFVCGAIPAGWAATLLASAAASGERDPKVLLIGALAPAAAALAALLLVKGQWAFGLVLVAGSGLSTETGIGGTPAAAALLACAAGLVCLMATLLDPPGFPRPSTRERE